MDTSRVLDAPVEGDLEAYRVGANSVAGEHNMNRCVACGHRMGKAKGEDPTSPPINDLCPGCTNRNGEAEPWKNSEYLY